MSVSYILTAQANKAFSKACWIRLRNVFYFVIFFEAFLHVTLQTHHVYSTLKRRGNDCFHVVSTWNTRGVFVGLTAKLLLHCVKIVRIRSYCGKMRTRITPNTGAFYAVLALALYENIWLIGDYNYNPMESQITWWLTMFRSFFCE